jgi:Tol biopolymer transport system component
MVGQKIGPYEVVGQIGAGGMGEVFRARDTRLGREVAVKVLPPAFAGDPDRRARFEREAQAVATLSHPNIVAIHDTGVHEGQAFVVMELLAGQTLRERLGAGPVPVRKAIEFGVQIARGLGAAHGKGIVHRDLKPENIFLVDDGQVKILDFGLARRSLGSLDPGSEDPGLHASTTLAMTDPGTVMGTIGYMAPEQVRGQAVDARADLFAFGAVLYEMVSGLRAFQRDTAADTMTAILTQDPPELVGSRPDLSPALDRIIRHCLEKNANERFQSARDVAFALEALSGAGVTTGVPSGAILVPPPTRSERRWLMPVAALVLAAVALAGGYALGRARGGGEPSDLRFESKTWDPQWVTNARFAPDGQTIVFSAAATGSTPSLFAIRPGALISQPIGKPGTHLLSVSSKGELAVLVNADGRGHRIFHGTLARMTLDGASRDWMDDVVEADWSPDGSTLAITRGIIGKMQLEYPIGKVLHSIQAGYLSDPRVSPDGTQVAFFEHPINSDNRGFVKVADAGGVRLLAGEYWALEGLTWSVDGRSVMFSGSHQGSEAMQPMAVTVSGEPRVRQALTGAGGMIVFDVARDGRVLIARDELRISIRGLVPGETAERDFSWLDASVFGYFTRDARRLIFNDESQSAGADYQVALRDVASGQVVRLGPGITQRPSPDGKWAPALVASTGRVVLYPTGTGDTVTLDKGAIEKYSGGINWFPDNRRVILCGSEKGKAPRCYEQEIPKGTPKPITGEGVTDVILAPDGRTLLLSHGDDTNEVMTLGGGAPVPLKGIEPNDLPFGWSSDSRGVMVAKPALVPTPIDRVDIATGKRTRLREVAPPDRSGLVGTIVTQWIDDGRGYSYTYVRELSRIFIVTGVK